jgi:hypothetical protein
MGRVPLAGVNFTGIEGGPQVNVVAAYSHTATLAHR